MDTQDFYKKLTNPKLKICEKLEYFYKLKESDTSDSKNKRQFMIDWLCLSLEFVSKTDKFIEMNQKDINQLLKALIEELHCNSDIQSQIRSHIKSNFLEVLGKFFQHKEKINQENVIYCWLFILQDKSQRYSVSLKSNLLVDVLSHVCNHLWKNRKNEIDNTCLDIICILSEIYQKQVKNQLNFKKVFAQFCNKLLLPLLLARTYCDEINSESSLDTVTKLENILYNVLNEKDHAHSLKAILLKEDDGSEAPTPKKQKQDLYFSSVFDQFKINDEDVMVRLLLAVPKLYEKLIVVSRNFNGCLSHYDEFKLLIYLSNVLQFNKMLLKNKAVVCKAYHGLLDVVLKHDIYQAVEDAEKDNVLCNWMKDYVKMLIATSSKCDASIKTTVLKTFNVILAINHIVLEEFLSSIWRICLDKDDCTHLNIAKETLLTSLLNSYGRLHQLHKFMFSLSMSEDCSEITYPVAFIERYSFILYGLQLSQINEILETYLEKHTVLRKEKTECSIALLEQFTYLTCYLVLINASVIPESGYVKDDLLKTFDILKRLKSETMYKISDDKPRCQRVSLLVQHAINGIYSLLEEFSLHTDCSSLLDMQCGNDDVNDKVIQYLQICFTFEKLRHKEFTAEALLQLHVLTNDIQLPKEDEIWNKQIFCITLKSFYSAVMECYSENLLLLIQHGDESLINVVVKQLYQTSSQNISSLFQDLSCYTHLSFQKAILHSINGSVSRIVGKTDSLEIERFFTVLVSNKEDLIECINEAMNIEGSKNLSEDEKTKLEDALDRIGELPLKFLTSDSLLMLSLIVHRVQCSLSTKQTVFNRKCFLLLHKIADIINLLSFKSCLVPFVSMFERNLKHFIIQVKSSEKIDDVIISGFGSLMKSIIKYGCQGDENKQLCAMISSYLLDESTQACALAVCKQIFSTVNLCLKDPIIKSRSERTSINVTLELSKSILPLLINSYDISMTLLEIFTSLCEIVNLTRVKKLNDSPLIVIEDDMVEIYTKLLPTIHIHLTSETVNENNLKFLMLIVLMFESSSEFNLRLRSLLQRNESEIVSYLIKQMNMSNSNESFYCNSIKSIVLNVDEKKQLELLNVLTDSMVNMVNNLSSNSILKIWKSLLDSKWQKEQRIVLWNVLPKVMLACVHVMTNMSTISELQLPVQVLISCVNLSKNSLMSQYTTCIYQVFTIISCILQKITDLEGFAEFFCNLYQLASQLLFNHQPIVYTSIPTYLDCVNSLLNLLVMFSRTTEKSATTLSLCCEKIARLYREIGSHKTLITKYSPYIIADYVRACQTVNMDAACMSILDSGIYCILDSCTDFEFSLLNTVLEKGDKEHYRMIRTSYEKHHKYQGKA